MPDEITGGMWGLALAVFVLGVAAGIAVAYLWVLRDKRSDVLEHELQKQQDEFEAHLQKVDAHFVRTSELFQEMTENYRAVYEHLAVGANDLCSDRVVAKQVAHVDNPPLVERSGEEEAGPEPAPEEAERPPQAASGAWDETSAAEAPATGGTGEAEEAVAQEDDKTASAKPDREENEEQPEEARR